MLSDLLPGLRVPEPAPHSRHAYYRFYAYVRAERLRSSWSRDRIVSEVSANGSAVLFRFVLGNLSREGVSRNRVRAPGGAACCARVGRNQRGTPRAPYVGCDPHVAGCRRRPRSPRPGNSLSQSPHGDVRGDVRACSLQAWGSQSSRFLSNPTNGCWRRHTAAALAIAGQDRAEFTLLSDLPPG